MILAFVLAQAAAPKFEDFPAPTPFQGTLAKPILRTSWQRTYRTRIRDAVKEGPNFAGHFKIAEWGCGSDCVGIAIIDEQTGAVYDGPFHILAGSPTMTYPDAPSDPALGYKLASRLLVVHGCPGEKDCASYYYEWTGTQFKLLRKLPAVESH